MAKTRSNGVMAYRLTPQDWSRLREWELRYNLDKAADIQQVLKAHKNKA